MAEIRTSEDVVVSAVGRELYEKFFRGYTRKQWGLDPSELDKSVTSRVPTRTNTDDRYFGDSFQNMPLHGYTRMFENMLDHPNIKVMLNTDFEEVRHEVQYDKLIYTGPIDEYFDFRFGKLPYRSLQFRHETVDQENFQPVAVVNYPSESVPYTRVTEYKHLTGQVSPRTSLTYEYPGGRGRPVLSRAAPGERRAVPQVPGAGRRHAGRDLRRPAGAPTATTTWTRWSVRRSPCSTASSRARSAIPGWLRATREMAEINGSAGAKIALGLSD